MLRQTLIIVFLVSVTTFAQAEKTTHGLEELIRLKQRLILEHMAGDGETHLQRSLRNKLDDKDTPLPEKDSPPYLLSPYSINKPRIQQFEAQYVALDGCDNWKNERHMVECQNH